MLVIKHKARNKLSDEQCAALYRDAHAAGQHAADLIPKTYQRFTMPDGKALFRLCTDRSGIAFVYLPVGSFRNWAERNELTHDHRLWVTGYNSDLRRKEAYAEAFNHSMHLHGIGTSFTLIED